MMDFDKPHRRYNPLTGEWLLLSPHRSKRPWQGKTETEGQAQASSYDETCYLCPGNIRASGEKNPQYKDTYVFTNDFSALIQDQSTEGKEESALFRSEPASGICKVICFSDRHDLSLAQMDTGRIKKVISVWIDESKTLGKTYQWVQIFENKGEIMGCSNPHPHGQIWATDFIPEEPAKEDDNQKRYLEKNHSNLLLDYLKAEIRNQERMVAETDTWAAMVPYWAIWPYEILLIPKSHTVKLDDLDAAQQDGLAEILKEILVKYDNIFETSFPYSMGWHGAPNVTRDISHWQLHAHFYPPLLRSATVKKFMVGYEMLCSPQRDITPEAAAQLIRAQFVTHYGIKR